MNTETRTRIANAVQTALRKEHPTGKRARVQAEGIVEEAGIEADKTWFYVPVEIAPYDREMGTFYELFSVVEESLESEGVNVLLVPVRREIPAGEFRGT